ncbi:MAG: hypothetical protein RIQ34_1568, partial [Bacteroidota bacterium]
MVHTKDVLRHETLLMMLMTMFVRVCYVCPFCYGCVCVRCFTHRFGLYRFLDGLIERYGIDSSDGIFFNGGCQGWVGDQVLWFFGRQPRIVFFLRFDYHHPAHTPVTL